MAHQNDARARAGELSAQAWGSAAQNVGQSVAGAVSQITDPRRQIEQEQVKSIKRTQDYTKTVNGIVSNLMQQNPDGSRTLDRAKLQQALSAQNVPLAMQQDVFKSLDDVDKSVSAFHQAKVDHMADLAHGVLQAGGTPEALSIGMALAKANGLATDADLEPLSQAATSGNDLKPLLQQMRGMSEKYKEMGKPVVLPDKATLVNPLAPQGTPPIASNVDPNDGSYTINGQRFHKDGTPLGPLVPAQHPPVQKSLQRASVLLDGKAAEILTDPDPAAKVRAFDLNGTPITDAANRIKPIPSSATVSIEASKLSDVALDQAARKYLSTGELPPGYGTAGVMQKTAIQNRAAQLDPNAALARNSATFKADSANLTNLQKTEGTLSAFEATAGKNLDQFLELAKNIPDTGVPWLNMPVRMLTANLVGSQNMAAINAARDVALREIARVTNDPKLSGALTDSARAEVLGLSPQNATLPQIRAVAKVLKQDMANVHSGLREQIDSVKSGIAQNPSAPKSETLSVGDTYKLVNGKWVKQ